MLLHVWVCLCKDGADRERETTRQSPMRSHVCFFFVLPQTPPPHTAAPGFDQFRYRASGAASEPAAKRPRSADEASPLPPRRAAARLVLSDDDDGAGAAPAPTARPGPGTVVVLSSDDEDGAGAAPPRRAVTLSDDGADASPPPGWRRPPGRVRVHRCFFEGCFGRPRDGGQVCGHRGRGRRRSARRAGIS